MPKISGNVSLAFGASHAYTPIRSVTQSGRTARYVQGQAHASPRSLYARMHARLPSASQSGSAEPLLCRATPAISYFARAQGKGGHWSTGVSASANVRIAHMSFQVSSSYGTYPKLHFRRKDDVNFDEELHSECIRPDGVHLQDSRMEVAAEVRDLLDVRWRCAEP